MHCHDNTITSQMDVRLLPFDLNVPILVTDFDKLPTH